jgi:cytochrome c peroxidase
MIQRLTAGMLLAVLTLAVSGAGAPKAAGPAGEQAGTTVWSAEEWVAALRLTPLPPLPPDPTNALADNLQTARLGHRLFFDARLSPHGVACATCHKPDLGFTDGLVVADTLAPVHRNTMTILNVGYYRWLTWDGARDSLWHQAVGPIESPKEMGASRLYVVRTVMQHYGDQLTRLASLPDGWQTLWPTLPAAGKPGEPVFDNLPPAHQEAVNRVFATILKTIAAYERHVVSAPAPFDRFVAGDRTALSVAAQRGFRHFLRLQCDTCHNTPLFSDDEFHNLGLPPNPEPDQGRATALPRLQHSLFRGTGPYADGPPVVRAEDYRVGQALLGSFRTPSLRGLIYTAPYGHNGSIATLEDWLDHYERVTTQPDDSFVGNLDPALPTVRISPQDKRELIAFLRSLSSRYASEWTREPTRPDGSKAALSSRQQEQ